MQKKNELVALEDVLLRCAALHPRTCKEDVARVAALNDLMTNYRTDCGRTARKRPELLAPKAAAAAEEVAAPGEAPAARSSHICLNCFLF